MDAQEFKKDFLEDIKADAAATGEGSCASFVTAFARYLQEADYLLDFTSSYFEGIGKQNRKLRVDGYVYDEFDKTMSLIVADYDVLDNERVLTKTRLDNCRIGLSILLIIPLIRSCTEMLK